MHSIESIVLHTRISLDWENIGAPGIKNGKTMPKKSDQSGATEAFIKKT